MEYIFYCIFIFAIVVQELLHRAERKDLYSRIMANDLTEYQSKTVKPRTIKNVIKKNLALQRESKT